MPPIPKPRQPKNNNGRIPPQVPPEDKGLGFSFRYLDLTSNSKFSIDGKDTQYFTKLLERLKAVSSIKCSEFMSARGNALRAHPLNWDDTSERDGFMCLNEQLRTLPAYQFEISANAHGRVHGVITGNVFVIVWLDPNHKLFPKKK